MCRIFFYYIQVLVGVCYHTTQKGNGVGIAFCFRLFHNP